MTAQYKVLTPIQYDKERREIGFIASFEKLSKEALKDLLKQKILSVEEAEKEKIYTVIKANKVKLEGNDEFLEEGVEITENAKTDKPISNMLNWGWIEEVK